MPTTTDRVNEILEQEFALRVTLERGLMNRQALCRWLIKNYELDAGVDAIDRVLREWDGQKTEGPLQNARRAFAHVTPSGNFAVSVLRVKRTAEIHEKIGTLFDKVDGEEEDSVHIIPDSGEFLVALDCDHAQEAIRLLGAENVRKRSDDFRLLRLDFQGPNPGSAAAALAISALASCDVEVPYTMSGSTEQMLLLQEDDVGPAFGIIEDLKQSISAPDEGRDEV